MADRLHAQVGEERPRIDDGGRGAQRDDVAAQGRLEGFRRVEGDQLPRSMIASRSQRTSASAIVDIFTRSKSE
ncbi:MAG: hypothetical protein PVG25_04500 [Anaerolineae bacterium]|jgi:hypothetical protein